MRIYFFIGGIFLALPILADTNVVKFECPSLINVNQVINQDIQQFQVNETKGLHVLKNGKIAKPKKPYDVHAKKADLIYRSSGVMPDEETEDELIYIKKYINSESYLSSNGYNFYCEYESTSITLKTSIDPSYKECSIIIQESDPANNMLKQVKMECLK